MEKLMEAWAKKSPNWEIRYEDFIKTYSDYGRGNTQYLEDRGKVFGAGYEMYIIAFFMGLYFDRRKPLTTDTSKKKDFGWAIQNWGNIESRGKRVPYGNLRKYMFFALVAKTDIDLIALDKGEVTLGEVVRQLITAMEEYANYGFSFMQDMIVDNPEYFFKEGAFLKMFLPFITEEETEEEGPESLD